MTSCLLVVCCLAARVSFAADGAGDAPEFVNLDKTGKLAPVNFPHKLHDEKAGGCKACHEGDKPLFAKKKGGGMKMSDMHAGKGCGSCHNGKTTFSSKTCMKCHKKEEKKAEAAPAAEKKAEPAADEKAEPAAAAAGGEAAEFISLDKTAKMAPVKFPHKLHDGKAGGCKACHEGDKPLFAQKKGDEGMKMSDMHAGKGCGSCHDGKKAFSSKTCMKCHKK
ncbi:MAG: hypothetical protein HY927_00365 [Elusimicrobia bacterium]|nr:hypothetical protein [Elusimicrobiota bacterium]